MNNIKDFLRYYVRLLIRNFIRIFFIFPIKEDRIIFIAYLGEKITDNPKCIYDYLQREYADKFEYIWTYNYNKNNLNIPDNVKVVKRFSLKWFYFMATSKVIVDDCCPTILIPKRKGQYYIDTWHAGGAYKKVGISCAETKADAKLLNKAKNTIDLFISSSKEFTKGNIETGYHYYRKVLNCGMPRNDVFFREEAVKVCSEKVKDYYSIKGIVVLYAPTFRGDIKHSDGIDTTIDINCIRDLLKLRYGTDTNILVRGHHWDKHFYDYGNDVIDAKDYPDMQELLCASDILITDYSSSIWDFALLGRPCFLYTPDIDDYIKNRGFFVPIEEWPGILCRTMEELCSAVVNFDEEECAEKAKKHLTLMGSYENGHATEIISNEIVRYTNIIK